MAAPIADPVQRLSKTLFGQVHRLHVMDWIARSDDGLINPGDMAADLGFRAQSAVQAPLRDLEDAGLITRMPSQAGRTYYQRSESLVWAWIIEVMDEQSRRNVAARRARP